MKHSTGFTLIELSILLVIVALIAGGVLVGKDMVQSAEWRKDISSIEKINLGISTFKTKYACMPGDCATARNFFPASSNGNGNGIIDVAAYNALIINTGGEESSLLNEHLAYAGMIPLEPFDRSVSSNYAPWKAWLQLSNSFGGVFVMSYNGQTYMLLTAKQAGGNAIYLNYGIATPIASYYVDSKMDDGLPVTGRLTYRRQLDAAPGLDNRGCLPGNGYDVFPNIYNVGNANNQECLLALQINF